MVKTFLIANYLKNSKKYFFYLIFLKNITNKCFNEKLPVSDYSLRSDNAFLGLNF